MVKERLKFFIRFKKNTSSNVSFAIAKQEKMDAIKSSYASINDQEFKDIFSYYQENSRIYWIKRGEFYQNYYNDQVAAALGVVGGLNEGVDKPKQHSSFDPIDGPSIGILTRCYHSLNKFYRRQLTAENIFRLLIILSLVFLCLFQCYTMIINYLAYPSSVNLQEFEIAQLLETLPGVTICNNNRLSLKLLTQRNSRLKEEIEREFGSEWHNRSYYIQNELDRFRDKLNQIFIKLNLNPDEEILGTKMHDQFKIKPESTMFIKWLDCARSWVDTVECDQFKQIHSVQDRRCTTFFYEGVLYYNLINRPDLFNSSRNYNRGWYSYFDTKQVAKFILDFQAIDYGDLKRQIGARVIFHSRKQVATQSDVDYFVTRGYRYDFHISRLDTKRLGHPYDTHCRDYLYSNIREYTTNPNTSTRIELNRQACLQNCIVKNAISKCNCFPPLMPYYENDELDPNKKLEVCRWSTGLPSAIPANLSKRSNLLNTTITTRKNYTSHKYYDCYKIFHRRCHDLCPAECRTTQYSVVSERMKWPSDAKLLFGKDIFGSPKVFRSCCAMITIKFADFQHTVHHYVPKFNLVDLIGNLGGLLALWLGISIVSVYYTVKKLVALIKERRRHMRRINPMVENSNR